MLFSGKTYFVINKKANTAMDLSGSDQTAVIGWDQHGGDNQKWRFVRNDDSGAWTIQNVGFNKYLDIAEGGARDGIHLIGSHSAQLWDVRPDERDPSGWRIFIRDSNQNVDLSDHGNPTPGTIVTLWSKADSENQVWWLQPVDPINPLEMVSFTM